MTHATNEPTHSTARAAQRGFEEKTMRQCKQAMLAALASLGVMASAPASATCSADPLLGSICITAYNFCPRGYADTHGQLLSIAQNTALFSLLGTTFGGDGQVTFALPDLRGRVPRGVGQGPGLPPVTEGEVSGQESVTLTTAQMPPHTHTAQVNAVSSPGTADSPSGAMPAKSAAGVPYGTGAANTTMAAGAVTVAAAGSGQPVGILNPYLGLRFCIATQGIYPSRN